MTREDILQLAVGTGLHPKTFERRGIKETATDEEIEDALNGLHFDYVAIEKQANRVVCAVGETIAKMAKVGGVA